MATAAAALLALVAAQGAMPVEGPPSTQILASEAWQLARRFSASSHATFSVRDDRLLYVSRLNDCDGGGCDDAMLYVHNGYYVQDSRFSVTPVVLWMANSYRLAVYSVEYRLASQGATYAQTLDDIVTALRWVRARHPSPRRLALVGVSSGGSFVMQLMRGFPASAASAARGVDVAVVDSSPLCYDTLDDDIQTEHPDLDFRFADFPSIQAARVRNETLLRGNCDVSPLSPTLVLASENDFTVPISQIGAYANVANNVTTCIASGGTHMASLDGACRDALRDSLDGAGFEREAWSSRTYAWMLATVVHAVASALGGVSPSSAADALCFSTVDPGLRTALRCDDHVLTTTPPSS